MCVSILMCPHKCAHLEARTFIQLHVPGCSISGTLELCKPVLLLNVPHLNRIT